MQKEINVILGERLLECRKAHGYTREAFSEIISVSPRFLAEVERGNAGVSLTTLKSMATALNESTDYLLGIASNKEQDDPTLDRIISKIRLISPSYYKSIDAMLDAAINIAKNQDPVIK